MEIIWFSLSAYTQLHIQFPRQVLCIWIHLVMRKIPIMWETNTSIFKMLLRNSFLAFSRLEVSFTFFFNRMSSHLLQQVFGIMKYSIYCSIHWHNVYCYSSSYRIFQTHTDHSGVNCFRALRNVHVKSKAVTFHEEHI